MIKVKRITRIEADRLIETKKPWGLYYFKAFDGYTGIDNTTGTLKIKQFMSYDHCHDWLIQSETESLQEWQADKNRRQTCIQ